MKSLFIKPIERAKGLVEVGWNFGDQDLTFGLVKESDLESYIPKLRKQQKSIGNDDFEIDDRRSLRTA